MRRRGGLSGLRPELEGDMPPRVEVRPRARQMQNEAIARSRATTCISSSALIFTVPQPAHPGFRWAGGTHQRRRQPQLLLSTYAEVVAR